MRKLENNAVYMQICHVVMNLNITNDTSEKALKEDTEYINSMNDGGQRGNNWYDCLASDPNKRVYERKSLPCCSIVILHISVLLYMLVI